MKTPSFPNSKLDYLVFSGGLDDSTPPLEIPSGYARRAQNYECGINDGYSSISGYERFDGRTKPSDSTYSILNATITASYAVGNTLTGVTSGATAVIAGATATYFIVTKVVGNFHAVSETLNISGSPVATSIGIQIADGATTVKLHAQYRNMSADIYRADITDVGGASCSGDVLGAVLFNDVWYAFRNNAAATAALLYKSSSSGWTAVTLFYEVSFTAGSGTPPAESATITQGANSATVKRVVLQSGSWGAGTAAGRFIITNPAPGNFTAGAFTAGVTATCSGAATVITLTAGGRYEFDIANFGTVKRIYGCSGVQRGFEFDGTVYVPITTGMTTDNPSFVRVHKNHLFFAFSGSAQHSGINTPYTWTVITGAAEIAMGDTITALIEQPGSQTGGGALTIFSRNHIKVLYGNNATDWNLVTYADEQGAYAYSPQKVAGNTLMLDDRGISSLATSVNYGNFESSTLSRRIQKLINSQRTKIKASCVARDKNQYRLFSTDKTALYLTFSGNKLKGIMPQLLSHDVTCIWSGEMNDGSEAICFGSSNGYLYMMERGTSFDGDDIESYIYLVFNPSRTARQRKRYKRLAFEITGDGYSEFNVGYELGYNSTEISQPDSQMLSLNFSPVFWDSFTWDAFTWDGTSLTPSSLSLEGSAENISLILRGKSDYLYSATISGAFIHYVPRRGMR